MRESEPSQRRPNKYRALRLGAYSDREQPRRSLRVRSWFVLAVTVSILAISAGAYAATGSSGPAEGGNSDMTSRELVVETEMGRVRGLQAEGVEKFLAIPYTAPPTGNLRWKPPAPALSWTGTRDATKFGSACPQSASENGPEVDDEDCLFVNVFRPQGTSEQSQLPVYFFIHGGGNTSGSSTQHDATKFAQHNQIVVVTVNYRLGVFGFLGLPSLRAESSDNSSGNYGLMDQQAAMRWTQRNISRFGGDPRRVTIGGQSAGARSVCYHLTSPTARDLFRGAVMESGGCDAPSMTALESSGANYAAAAGCPDATTAAECLRSKSPQELLRLSKSTTVTTQPAVGGALLPQEPIKAISSGLWNRVPVLLGANHDEQRIFLFLGIGGKLPVTDTGYLDRVRSLFGANADRVLSAYPLSTYPNASIALSSVLDGFVGRSCRSIALADAFAETTAVWHFEFNDRTAPQQFASAPDFPLGATHSSELQYFYAFDSTRQLGGPQVTLSSQMQAYWTHFADTGNPDSAGGPSWPRWTPAKHETLSLQTGGNTIRTSVGDDHKCAFWSSLGFGLP